MKFAFIAAEKAFPVAVMCEVFGVSTSGFYARGAAARRAHARSPTSSSRSRSRRPTRGAAVATAARAFIEHCGAAASAWGGSASSG